MHSKEILLRIVYLRLVKHETYSSISSLLGISKSVCYAAVVRFFRLGRRGRPGRPHALTPLDLILIDKLIYENSDIYLDELKSLFFRYTFKQVSETTLL